MDTVDKAECSRFRDAAELWLGDKSRSLKPQTIAKYRNLLNVNIYPAFEDIYIPEMTSEQLISYADEMRSRYSEKHVDTMLSAINSVLEYARMNGVPVMCRTKDARRTREAADAETGSKAEGFSAGSPEMRGNANGAGPGKKRLTRQDAERLKRHLERSGEPRAVGVLISLTAGLRLGEVCALRWSNVDLDNGWISVTSTVQRMQSGEGTGVVITAPQSKASIRKVTFAPEIAMTLRAAKQKASLDDGYVLSGGSGRIIEPRNLQRYFKKVLRVLGIPDVPYSALREAYIEDMLSRGVNVIILKEMLGVEQLSAEAELLVRQSYWMSTGSKELRKEVV